MLLVIRRASILLSVFLIVCGFTEPEPFWKGNRKLETRLADERAILVSVRSLDVPAGVRFSLRGVGWLRRDRREVLALAMRFDDLKKVSEHFHQVKWEPQSGRLFVVGRALGYEARMLLKIDKLEGVSDKRDEIRFKVIDGHFPGLAGAVSFETKKTGLTEMAIWSLQEGKELPLPRFLVGFALEVVASRIAEKMRQHLESAVLSPSEGVD